MSYFIDAFATWITLSLGMAPSAQVVFDPFTALANSFRGLACSAALTASFCIFPVVSATAGAFVDNFGGEGSPEVGELGTEWISNAGQGNWEVSKGILRGSFSPGGNRQIRPALLLASGTEISDTAEPVYEISADVAVRSEANTHSAGIAAQVLGEGDEYYVLRINLLGVVQLIRTGASDTLLDEKLVGKLVSGQPYRLTLRSLGSGKLEWKVESPVRTLAEGFAEDPTPLTHGGMAGLWTNSAARDGEPTAHFRLFGFHAKSSGLENELPFLDEVDPDEFPPIAFPELADIISSAPQP